jgi:hypothetical protein
MIAKVNSAARCLSIHGMRLLRVYRVMSLVSESLDEPFACKKVEQQL